MLSARPLALDGEMYHAKTPARAARDRNMLQENVHRIPMTVNGKGKALQTPRRAMTVQSHKALSHSVKPTIRVQKPLGDKTPFPNRVANAVPFDAPAPQTAKLAKLALLEAPQEALPEPLMRPSSVRKSLRAPRLSGGMPQLDFKTPVTRGDHWNVSDGEIDVDADEEAAEVASVQGEDDDEIEYMPPTAIVPPYEPPFEMPDYTQLGAAIRGLAHSYKFDDADDLRYAHDVHIDIESHDVWRETGFASLDSPMRWDVPELAPLENELLIHDKPTRPNNQASSAKARPTPTTQHKHTSSLPAIRATSSARSIPSTTTTTKATRPLSRAPSATSTASSSRMTSSSSATSTKPTTRPAVAPSRPRSQTTSQIARPASAPSTKLESGVQSRAGVGVSSRGAALKAQAPVARAKTATSVHAMTTTARAASGAPAAASKPVSGRLGMTRPAPVPARVGASRATNGAVVGKPGPPRVGAASGQRSVGLAAGKKPADGASEESDLLSFDDLLVEGDDFAFDV